MGRAIIGGAKVKRKLMIGKSVVVFSELSDNFLRTLGNVFFLIYFNFFIFLGFEFVQ